MAAPHAADRRPTNRVGGSKVRFDSAQPGRSHHRVAAQGVSKSYRKGKLEIPVLRGVDLEVRPGEFTAIVGQSGSGKSTLLHLLATLDSPDKGQILFDGNRIDNLPQAGRDVLRNRDFGVIFQFYHLLPELTALENVMLPAMIAQGLFQFRRNRAALRSRAADLLDRVELSHRFRHRPGELSGGEMQRVAIARSLFAEPKVLFADEPTGNLDCQTGSGILKILRSLNQKEKLTIVMVTHDDAIARQADRIVRMEQGLIR